MNKGIIAINKSQNWTSFDVVNKIKHMVKPLKVGHLGTLDPMATGVLLVTIGKATKLFDIMQEKSKTYVAQFKFGEETDSLDSTGKVVKTTNQIPTKEQIIKVLINFVGEYDQIPPKYSAKSINGQRAYDLARKNIEFEVKPKKVKINSISLIDYEENILSLEINCGSGTYIRSIGRDIAYKLDSLATMTSLIRTKIDSYSIDKCVDIDNLNKDNIFNHITPINEILTYPILELSSEDIFKILNGQTLNINLDNGSYLIKSHDDIVAIAKSSDKNLKMSIFLG